MAAGEVAEAVVFDELAVQADFEGKFGGGRDGEGARLARDGGGVDQQLSGDGDKGQLHEAETEELVVGGLEEQEDGHDPVAVAIDAFAPGAAAFEDGGAHVAMDGEVASRIGEPSFIGVGRHHLGKLDGPAEERQAGCDKPACFEVHATSPDCTSSRRRQPWRAQRP